MTAGVGLNGQINVFKSLGYGVPFSHLFTELQISAIEVHISPIQLQISPIQLEISAIQLEISPNRSRAAKL